MCTLADAVLKTLAEWIGGVLRHDIARVCVAPQMWKTREVGTPARLCTGKSIGDSGSRFLVEAADSCYWL